MIKILFLKRSLAIGQKLRTSSSAYGEGHNLQIEVGFALPLPEGAREAFNSILNRIDHKALGKDVDLGFEPTTLALAKYLASEFKRTLGCEVEVRIQRGDFSGASL